VLYRWLFESLTVIENLMAVGPIYGLTMSETAARAADLLGLLDLTQGRHTVARNCSFGMRKKTALAMALLHKPRFVLLDEPFEAAGRLNGMKTGYEQGRSDAVFGREQTQSFREKWSNEGYAAALEDAIAVIEREPINEGFESSQYESAEKMKNRVKKLLQSLK
jgi:ABC transporter family protein